MGPASERETPTPPPEKPPPCAPRLRFPGSPVGLQLSGRICSSTASRWVYTPGMKPLLPTGERQWARNLTGEGELAGKSGDGEVEASPGPGGAGGHPGARLLPLPPPGKNPSGLVGAALLGYLSFKEKGSPSGLFFPAPEKRCSTEQGLPQVSARGGTGDTGDTSNCIGIPRGLGLKLLRQ